MSMMRSLTFRCRVFRGRRKLDGRRSSGSGSEVVVLVVVGSFVVSVVVLFIRLQRSRIEALSRFLNLNRSIFPENYDFSLALP